MKLEEKLFNAMFDNLYHFKTENVVPEVEKIADDFAIDFADWKDENCFQATGTTLWYIPESDEFTSTYTNKQLLEIYKKQI